MTGPLHRMILSLLRPERPLARKVAWRIAHEIVDLVKSSDANVSVLKPLFRSKEPVVRSIAIYVADELGGKGLELMGDLERLTRPEIENDREIIESAKSAMVRLREHCVPRRKHGERE